MICQPCRHAADKIGEELANPRSPHADHERALRRYAAQHRVCRGGTWCDCRHQTRLPAARVIAYHYVDPDGGPELVLDPADVTIVREEG